MLTDRQQRLVQQEIRLGNMKAQDHDSHQFDGEIEISKAEKEQIILVGSAEKQELNPKQIEEQKQIEDQFYKEFLPDFKSELSKKYKTLKSELKQEIDRTDNAKKILASFYENSNYKSKFYSTDVFIRVADYLKDKKETSDVTFLDTIKKDTPLSLTVDMFSQRLEELNKLKSDIEHYEKESIEQYKTKIIISLTEGESQKKAHSIKLSEEVDSIKNKVIAKLRKTATNYHESSHFQDMLKKDKDSAIKKYNQKFHAVFDDSAPTKSLGEIEILFNETMAECVRQRGWSSLAENLLMTAANELAQSEEHIRFVDGKLRINSEELIKNRVIEVEMELNTKKQSTIKKGLLTEADRAIHDFDYQLQVHIKNNNYDINASNDLQIAAPTVRDVLINEGKKINTKLDESASACRDKLKEVSSILSDAQLQITEVNSRYKEKQESFLRCANAGTLNREDVDVFSKDMGERSLGIELELAKAKKLLPEKKDTQELKLQSNINDLYDAALSQFKKARESLGGTTYQENDKKPKHYQKVFSLLAENKIVQEKKLANRNKKWKKASDNVVALKSYAESALIYSEFNKKRMHYLEECKITSSQIEKIAAAKRRAITNIKNAIDQNRAGDLIVVQTILEDAKKNHKFAKESFDKTMQIFEDAEKNKLAAEVEFKKAKEQHPTVSFEPYQKMVDYANAQYESALKEKIGIEEQFKQANQNIEELAAYAFFADECVKLNKSLDQIAADKVELEKMCAELDKVSTDVDINEIRKIVSPDIKTPDIVPVLIEDKEAKQPMSQVVKGTHETIQDLPLIDAKLTEVINKKLDPFFKADAFLNQQNVRRQQFLLVLNGLKDALGDKKQEEKNQASFINQEANKQALSIEELKNQFNQCLSAMVERETQIPNHENNKSLSKVISIPQKIITNHFDAVNRIRLEEKKAEEKRIADERKKIEEAKREEDKKIVNYLKNFLEKNEKHLHKEVVGGTKLNGRDVKIQGRLAEIYNKVLLEDKKTPSGKLQEVKEMIAARLKRKSFFSTENGFADLLSKAIENILNKKDYNFEDVKTKLDQVRDLFVKDTTSQPHLAKSPKR